MAGPKTAESGYREEKVKLKSGNHHFTVQSRHEEGIFMFEKTAKPSQSKNMEPGLHAVNWRSSPLKVESKVETLKKETRRGIIMKNFSIWSQQWAASSLLSATVWRLQQRFSPDVGLPDDSWATSVWRGAAANVPVRRIPLRTVMFSLVPVVVKTINRLTWKHLVKYMQIKCPPDPLWTYPESCQTYDSSRKSSAVKSHVSIPPFCSWNYIL